MKTQSLGLIEMDLPSSLLAPGVSGESSLWQDILRIAGAAGNGEIGPSGPAAEHRPRPRWNQSGEPLAADFAATPAIQADLPRLKRDLDAEVCCLSKRLGRA